MANGTNWTLQEKDTLRACQGMKPKQIAKIITTRTADGIKKMATVLGISLEDEAYEHIPDTRFDGDHNYLFLTKQDMRNLKIIL